LPTPGIPRRSTTRFPGRAPLIVLIVVYGLNERFLDTLARAFRVTMRYSIAFV